MKKIEDSENQINQNSEHINNTRYIKNKIAKAESQDIKYSKTKHVRKINIILKELESKEFENLSNKELINKLNTPNMSTRSLTIIKPKSNIIMV